MSPITVAMMDDHLMFLEACTALVRSVERFRVIGSATNAQELYSIVAGNCSDLVLVDINMEPSNGFEVTGNLIVICPGTKVIGLSMTEQPAFAKKLVSMGGRGYLTKNCNKEELITAMMEVYEGRSYFSREIKNLLTEAYTGEKKGVLTKRELDIIAGVKQGLSSREIAHNLNISLKTLEVHRYNILKKLGLRNSAELVNYSNLKGP